MNNQEIDKLITVLEEMKTPEAEGIEIPDCDWMIDMKGDVSRSYSPAYNVEYGYKRTTEEACKLASERTIRTNRLSLLAHILGVEVPYSNSSSNYYVYQATSDNKWDSGRITGWYHPDRVYMTKEGAKSVAIILNNNEWKLELEE